MIVSMKTKHNETPGVLVNAGDVEIILYNDQDGDYNFSDTYLSQVYRKIVLEKTVYRAFYDVTLRDTRDFVSYCKRRDIEFFFIRFKGEDAGFFWLTPFVAKSAFIRYCLYQQFLGEQSLIISRDCIKAIFNRKNQHGEHKLDVLLGLTPANNKLGLKFLSKNGMTVAGKVPGLVKDIREDKPVDGIFSYLPRENGNSKKTLGFFLI